jgi:hypothetical protein
MMSLSLEEKGRDLFEKIEDVDFECIEFRLLEAGGEQSLNGCSERLIRFESSIVVEFSAA